MSSSSGLVPNTKGISVQSRQSIIIQSFKYKIQSLNEQVSELQEEIQSVRNIDHQQDIQEKCQELDEKMQQQSSQQKECIKQMQQHQNIFMEERSKQHTVFLDNCRKEYNRYIDDIVYCQDKFVTKGKQYQFKRIKRLKKIIGSNRRDLRRDQQKIQDLENRIKSLLRN